jgi:hypothetical protein
MVFQSKLGKTMIMNALGIVALHSNILGMLQKSSIRISFRSGHENTKFESFQKILHFFKSY